MQAGEKSSKCVLWVALYAAVMLGMALPALAQEGSPDQALNQIWLDYQSGKHNEVIAQIEAFAAQYREEPVFTDVARRLYYLGTLSAVRVKDWPRAVEMAESFAEAPGQSPGGWVEEVMFWRGVALQHVGRLAEARAVLVPFVEKFPDSPKAMPVRFLIGATYFREGDFDGAARYFASVRQVIRGAEWGRALLLEVMALLRAGRLDDAVHVQLESFSRIEELPQIAALQTLALESAGKLAKQGKPRQAIALLLHLKPRDEVLALQEMRLVDLEQQLTLIRSQDADSLAALQLSQLIDGIRKEMERLDGMADFDALARLQMASAWLSLKRFREAAFVLEGMLDSLDANPITESATDTLVKCLAEIRRWPKVVEVAEKFAVKYPDSKLLPGIRVLRGQAQMELGNFREAVQTFEDVVAKFSDNPLAGDALFLAGYSLALAQDFSASNAAFRKLVEAYPEHEKADAGMYWIGNTLSLNGQYEESIAEFEAYLEKFPDGQHAIDARYRIAFAWHALGEMERSIPLLEAFVSDNPDDTNTAEALLLLGEARLSQARIEEGIALLKQVPAGIGTFAEEAWFKIGKAYRLNNNMEQMRNHFREFQQKFPDSARVAEAVYWEGWTYRDDPDKVGAVYWQALEAHGGNVAQWGITQIIDGLIKAANKDSVKLAGLRLSLEQLAARAKNTSQKTLEARAEYALGLLASTMDNIEVSARHMRRTLELSDIEKENPALLIEVASVLRKAGDLEAAASLFADIRRWNPLSPVRDKVYAALGSLALEQGDTAKAEDYFRQFLRETPGSPLRPDVERQLASIEARRGDVVSAVKRLEAQLASKGLPKSLKIEMLMDIGRIHLQAGDPRKAFPYFQRVYVMYAGFRAQAAEAYLQSGIALEQLGDKVAAARTYLELLDQSGDFASVAANALTAASQRLEALPPEARENARRQINEKAAETQASTKEAT